MREIAAERLDPRNDEVEAQVNIGGFKLKASSDKGFDQEGFVEQAKDKAKTEIIWWGIGCAVVALVLVGLAGLGWYVWAKFKEGAAKGVKMEGGAAPEDAERATWDGKSPYTCGAGDNVKIQKVTAKLDKGTAITANGNCRIELDGVDITAPIGIQSSW